MTRFRQDPLLTIARWLLLFLMGVFAIGLAAVAIGLPVMAIWHQEVLAALQEDGAPAHVYWVLVGVVTLGGVVLYLAFLFVRDMKRIVDSVAEGDPFVPVNAERLTAMAWLMLAIQLLSIPIAAMSIYIVSLLESESQVRGDGGTLNGLVLVLVLFILARVFRKGAEMREDLQGTV